MKPHVTMKQVAEAAGVHFSTVSRVLNPATRERVSPDLVARVLAVADRLGYRANTLASSLRTRRSRVIGVVVPDMASLCPAMLEGIDETLIAQGYMTIIAATANDAARQRLALAGMMERQVDGLILATATLRDPAVEAWVEGRAPLVLIHRTDQTGRAPAVLSDEIKGIGLAVGHLASLGHRRLGHVGGPQHLSTGALRLRGFRDAIGKVGLADDQPIVLAESFSRDAGRVACGALMERHPDVTALVAANDLLALGCYDALAARGLRCPDDVSVTGHNDAPFVDMVAPPLTTVRVAQREMGVEAARLLLRLMRDDGEAPADILLPPSLVVRGSTARLKS